MDDPTKDDDKKRDEVLKRMLRTPPKKHDEGKRSAESKDPNEKKPGRRTDRA